MRLPFQKNGLEEIDCGEGKVKRERKREIEKRGKDQKKFSDVQSKL